jgi:hypothetical protein
MTFSCGRQSIDYLFFLPSGKEKSPVNTGKNDSDPLHLLNGA